MKLAVFLLAVAQLFLQTKAYTYCSYRRYNSYSHMYETRYYRCSSSQYCCGTSSCCTRAYARWYLWFVLTSFFLVIFIIWWYYRYRYRPRHAVVVARQAPAPVMTATTITSCQTATASQPAQYPYHTQAGYGYPAPGYPAGNAQYPAYPAYNKQGGPPQGYAPPPSYATATAAGQGLPPYPPQ